MKASNLRRCRLLLAAGFLLSFGISMFPELSMGSNGDDHSTSFVDPSQRPKSRPLTKKHAVNVQRSVPLHEGNRDGQPLQLTREDALRLKPKKTEKEIWMEKEHEMYLALTRDRGPMDEAYVNSGPQRMFQAFICMFGFLICLEATKANIVKEDQLASLAEGLGGTIVSSLPGQ